MKLRKHIVDQVNNVPMRRSISAKLNLSDQTVQKHLVANRPNGRLTRVDALVAIQEELSVPDIMNLVEVAAPILAPAAAQ